MKEDNTELPEFENVVIYSMLGTRDTNEAAAMIELMGDFDGRYFIDGQKGLIFDAMKALVSKGMPLRPDVVCYYLNDNRKNANLESSEFMDVIRGIVRQSPDMAVGESITAYTDALKEAYRKRRMLQAVELIQSDVYNAEGRSSAELLALALERLEKTEDEDFDTGKDLVPATMGMQELISEIRRGDVLDGGVMTGFPGIDVKLKGLKGGQLILIAARPGVGKSALALNIAQNIAKATVVDKPVIFFSLEMPQREIISRMICTDAQADLDHVLNNFDLMPHQLERLTATFTEYVEIDHETRKVTNKMYFRFGDKLTPGRIMLEVQKLKRQQGIGCVVIDYLQYIKPDKARDNRNLEVGEISNALKSMAKRFDIPVIALSQLNRDIDSRSDHVPQNSDLRDSGSLEQDADVIMFLNRDAANPPKKGKDGTTPYMSEEDRKKATLYITKNRNGQGGVVDLMYEGPQFRFYEPEQARGEFE